jgi:acetylornithine/succinyldiaminopimelate/putrescine aminotransferase
LLSLTKTYLVNSGTEAIEGAFKIEKELQDRDQINPLVTTLIDYYGKFKCNGFEERQVFRPLIPDVDFYYI